MKKEFEKRSFECEVRAIKDENGNGHTITGLPIVFEQETDLGDYKEVIAKGALNKTDLKDVRFLINHDLNRVPLARSRNNNENSTMRLTVTDRGLEIEVDLDTENNMEAKQLYSAVSRGDVTGMSFMFTVNADEIDRKNNLRTITEIGTVIEVSAVTFPAYQQTEINARNSKLETLESAESKSLDSDEADVNTREEESTMESEIEVKATEQVAETETESREAELTAKIEELSKKLEEAEERADKATKYSPATAEAVRTLRKVGGTMSTTTNLEAREAFKKYCTDAEYRASLAPSDVSYAIPTEIMDVVTDKMAQYGKLFNLVTKVSVPCGMDIPVVTLTGSNFGVKTPGVDDYGTNPVSAQSVVTFTEKIIGESFEVYENMKAFSLEKFESIIAERIAEHCAQYFDKGIITGTGTNDITGIANDARVTNTITVDLTDKDADTTILEGIKDYTNMAEMVYVFAESTKAYFKKMQDNGGRMIKTQEDLEFYLGAPVVFVPSDVIESYKTASSGDMIGLLWKASDYIINEAKGFAVEVFPNKHRRSETFRADFVGDAKIGDVQNCYKLLKA